MPQLDIGLRKAIVLRYHKTHNFAGVSREFGVDVSTVKRWVSRFEEGGDWRAVPSSGRRRGLSQAAARAVAELLRSEKFSGCKEVAVELRRTGLADKVVHASTLSRHAKTQALADGRPIVAKRGKPRKLLTASTRAKRLKFCKANLKRSWDNVMITDRCKFFFRYPGTSVKRVEWVFKGEERTAFKPNQPSCVNLYAGITKRGVTKAHIVTGTTKEKTEYKNQKGKDAKNITAAEYYDVVKHTLLPEGKRLLGHNGKVSWHLQQDNDPTHKRSSAKALKEWNSGGRGTVQLVAEWPPHSPDLSPIENAWAYIQARVDAVGCENFDESKDTLLWSGTTWIKRFSELLWRACPGACKSVWIKMAEKLGIRGRICKKY